MYSNEDLERFYFQYQTEALPSGESVQSFCKRNNVPYNIFSKWYKDTRKQTSTYNRLKTGIAETDNHLTLSHKLQRRYAK